MCAENCLSLKCYILISGPILLRSYEFSRIHGVGVLLAADSQSTSAVWVSGFPLGPLTRFLSCSSYFV
jgi:hypothetical protein